MSTNKNLTYQDFEILESIRGLASLYVVIAHCRGVLWIGGRMFLNENPMDGWSFPDYLVFGSSMLTRLAVEFVIIFFVLSGFSIAHSISKSRSVRGFYLRRIVRIYPPYLTALIWAGLVYSLTLYLHPDFYVNRYSSPTFMRYYQMNTYFEPVSILGNLLYLPMDGFITPFWSLTYEVIFYLLAPFLFINRKFYSAISVILFIIYHTLELGGIGYLEKNILILFLGVYNFYFFLGYKLYHSFPTVLSYLKRVSKKRFTIILFILLSLTYATNISLRSETIWSYLPAGLLGIALIIYSIKFQTKIPFLLKIGKHSYTLYITHFASIYLFHSLYFLVFPDNDPQYIREFWVFTLAVPFCILISYLQFQLVEGKTRLILNKLRAKP